MATAPLVGGDGTGNGNGEKHRWSDSSKVYSRKSFNKTTPSKQTLNPPSAASDDDSSTPKPNPNPSTNGHRRLVTISLASRSKLELRDLRRQLASELDQVRTLLRKLESRETSRQDPAFITEIDAAVLKNPLAAHRQLSVSIPDSAGEKEKRTPKANQYYKNSGFILGKEKFPPADSHKKSKSVDSRAFSQAFKSCAALLARLMKHKHGWVFNTPVDVKALGLHDYYTIIKHPMDLGTVKAKLSKNAYKSPEEFADDVRLTFRNAMTYNPKGQDVHVMAEQLLQLFEEGWPAIEAEYAYVLSPRPPPIVPKRPPPIDTKRFLERSDSTVQPVSVNSKTTSKPVSFTPQPHVGRPPSLKKPKAKDPNKREMTFEEKQKLSTHLESLPPEKLDNVVQIIKKRSASLSQHDDEIEVDIDSVDTETLWELDRFVTNYKKSLSKNKRKAEQLALLAQNDTAQEGEGPEAEVQERIEKRVEERMEETVQESAQEMVQERSSDPVIEEVPKESMTVADEQNKAAVLPGAEKKEDNANRSSSSSSSSSDSGSSSSDSDSDSSSAGSDAGRSQRS